MISCKEKGHFSYAKGASIESVALGDGLGDIPGAAHSFGEGSDVARLDRDWLTTRRRHGDLALDDVAGLGVSVGPGELGYPAAPSRPTANTKLGEVSIGGLPHDNGGHPQHEGGGDGQQEAEAEQLPPHLFQASVPSKDFLH